MTRGSLDHMAGVDRESEPEVSLAPVYFRLQQIYNVGGKSGMIIHFHKQNHLLALQKSFEKQLSRSTFNIKP